MALTRITKGVIKPNENYDTHNINSTGIVTAIGLDVNGSGDISGNLSVGGVLTYEDVTSIDSVGIITARDGIDCNGDIDVDGHTNLDNVSIAGVTTFSNTVHVGTGVTIETNGQGTFSGIVTSRGYEVSYADGGLTHNYIKAGRIRIFDNGSHCHFRFGDHPSYSPHQSYSSSQVQRTNSWYLQNTAATRYAITWVNNDGPVHLYYSKGYAPDYSIKLSTTPIGVTVGSGVTIETNGQATFAGITTFSGNIDANGDLDVDGHTNLDNVSIAGVTTVATFLQVLGAGGTSDKGFEVRSNSTQGTDTNQAIRVRNNSNTDTFKVSYKGKVTTTELDISGNIDVDGHTYLDNVSVAGVSTFTGNADFSAGIDVTGDIIATDDIIASDELRNNVANDFWASDNTFINLNGFGNLTHMGGFETNLTSNGYRDTNGQWVGYNAGSNGGAAQIGLKPEGSIVFRTDASKANGTAHNPTTRLTIDDEGVRPQGGTLNLRNSGSTGNVTINVLGVSGDSRIDLENTGNGNYSGIDFVRERSTGTGVVGGSIFMKSDTSTNDAYLYLQAQSASAQSPVTTALSDNNGVRLILKGGDGIFSVETGSSESFNITSNGNVDIAGEVSTAQDYPNFRPVLDFNFAATKKLKPEMTFTRNGEASFHDGVGSVKFALTDEPRFEHDIVTGECKGLMFEGAGTNYSWHSRRFYSSSYPAGSWVPINGGATPTITENTHTAPDGTSSGIYMADTITGATGTTVSGNVVRQQWTAGTSVKHTVSIYVKLITATQATIYLRDANTGSTQTASAIPNTKNWQRLVVTSSSAMTASVTHSWFIGNTNGTIAVWGSQIERSDHVTSYIKTEGGANGTRNTDKGIHLDGEDITDVFNQGEGTLIAEVILTQSLSNNPIVGFYENFASNNRLELRGDASSTGVARLEAIAGGSIAASLTTNLQHSGVNNVSKYAYAFQENNYAGCVNGGSVGTDTSGAFSSGINSMMIGEAVYQVDAAVIVKRIMYYADRLPNSQLVTLTS